MVLGDEQAVEGYRRLIRRIERWSLSKHRVSRRGPRGSRGSPGVEMNIKAHRLVHRNSISLKGGASSSKLNAGWLGEVGGDERLKRQALSEDEEICRAERSLATSPVLEKQGSKI